MEALAALSFTCNVLQLVETGIKLTAKIKEIRKRGSLASHDDAKVWAADVSTESKQLRSDLQANVSSLSRVDTRVCNLAQEAIEISMDLKIVLNQIALTTGPAKLRRHSLDQIMQTWRSKGTIEELTRRLEKCERSLDSTVLRELYKRAGKAEILNNASFSKLESGQQEILRKVVETDAKSFVRVVRAVQQSEQVIVAQLISSEKAIIAQTASTGEAGVAQTIKSERQVQDRMQQLHIDGVRRLDRHRLLDSLRFPSMNDRQHTIQQRVGGHSTAFDWILEPGQDHGFYEWLISEGRLYWISGKPGSGKSSLVDYILRHLGPEGSADDYLKLWSGPTAMLSFFFYSPTTNALQKTFEGLFRSLCYQVLIDDPELCGRVLIDADAPLALRRFVRTDHDYRDQWLTQDLEEFFRYLVGQRACRILLLLDGLDEFGLRERGESQFDLISTVKSLASDLGLKICCSSRPEVIFSTEFAQLPALQVQDLTYKDIEAFVTGKLEDTRASGLIEDIVYGADGVFLWAHVITEAILQAISEGELLGDMKKIIKSTHGDMTELFKAMLQRASPVHQQSSNHFVQYLMIGSSLNTEIYLAELLFTACDQEEIDRFLKNGLTERFVTMLKERASMIEQQVLARCAGLVHLESYMNFEERDTYAVYDEAGGDEADGVEASGDEACGSEADGGEAGHEEISHEDSDETATYTYRVIRQTSYRGLATNILGPSVFRKLSGTPVEFIHRTAYDFLNEDPAGKQFINTRSISEDAAYLRLLRGNVLKMVLGMTHPFLDARFRRCPESPGAWGRLAKIYKIQRRLETFPAQHQQYHLLSDQHLDNMMDDFNCSNAGIVSLVRIFSDSLWPHSFPLETSIRLGYASLQGLYSYEVATAQRLTLEERQLAAAYTLCTVAMDIGGIDAMKYDSHSAWLQALCGPEPIPYHVECRKFYFVRAAYIYELPTQPLGNVIMSLLMNSRLGMNNRIGRRGSRRDVPWFQHAVHTVLGFLQNDDGQKASSFELTIFDPDGGSELISPFWAVALPAPLRPVDGNPQDMPQLALYCTIERIVCFLLPGTGFPEWGLSGTGELPVVTRWKPGRLDRWFHVAEKQQQELWLLRDGYYKVNKNFTVEVSQYQLSELDGYEMAWLRNMYPQTSPGIFRVFAWNSASTMMDQDASDS